ncbi:MAG TPA: NUDIX hydrolase [Terriglobia bacterium]|nr:NUDIX hydrolase [Terriglobia bacterium]
MSDVKILSQETVFEGRVIKLRVDRLVDPSGNTITREIVVYPGAVTVVACPTPDSVLLVRQYRHATGKTLLELPAGGIETGEDPARAAIRELEEETGYRAGRVVERARFWTTPGFTSEYMYLYEALDLVETQTHPDEDEAIEIVRASRAEALQMIDDGRIEDAKSILGLLRVFSRP